MTLPSTQTYGLDRIARDTAYDYPYLNLRTSASDYLREHYVDWIYALRGGRHRLL
jgi:hypothetical protein